MSESPAGGLDIARLTTKDADFEVRLDALLAWEGVSDTEVQQRVDEILAAVKRRGDAAWWNTAIASIAWPSRAWRN